MDATVAIKTIRVSGADAFEFLQGQLTNDLERLEPEAEISAAWCNPKGRVIWFGILRSRDAAYHLSAPAETAELVVRRLEIFRFRSNVEFDVVDEGHNDNRATLIRAGRPLICTEQTEQFTPHMLNLDLLDAISLDKGCYTGQEIVARTHYKGATKRRTLRFESEKPVSVGDKVLLNGRAIGEVLNVAGTDLLAVVPVAKSAQALTVGDYRLTPAPLPYDITSD